MCVFWLCFQTDSLLCFCGVSISVGDNAIDPTTTNMVLDGIGTNENRRSKIIVAGIELEIRIRIKYVLIILEL